MPSNHTDEEIEKQVAKIEKMFQDAFDEATKPRASDIMSRLLRIAQRRRPDMGVKGNGSGQGRSSS